MPRRGCSIERARPPRTVRRPRRPALRIDVFSIFPEVVDAYCMTSVVGRARREGRLDLRVHDLRAAATDPHRSVDDAPFGGGAGMVLAPAPVFGAVELVDPPRPLYLLSPSGRRFDQAVAMELAGITADARSSVTPAFSLLCGRYEGVDQRIADHLADGELSVGDFVLAGGELAAMVVVEATVRLIPGVLGNEASAMRRELHDRASRVPAVHQTGRVPGLGGPRGPAGRRPWPGRTLAQGGVALAHARAATRPVGGPGRS